MNIKILFPLVFCLILNIFSCQNKDRAENKKLIIDEPKTALDSSINILTKKIVKHPDEDALYFQRAKLFRQKGKILLAINDMEKATALQSSIFEYFNLLGDLYFDATNINAAIKAYEKSTGLNPNSEYAFLKLGKIYLYQNSMREAIAYLNKAVEANKFNPEIFAVMAVYFLQKNDTVRAIESLKTSLRIDPEYFTSQQDLGYLLALKKDRNALFYLNNAVRIKPNDINALYNRGKYYQDIDSFYAAIADYESILSIDPSNISANYNLGYINFVLKKYQVATSYFTNVINNSPENKDAYLGRGLCYKELKLFEKARQDFQKILNIDPKDDTARDELNKLMK